MHSCPARYHPCVTCRILQEYSGSWVVETDPAAHTSTLLKYEISLQPKLSIPSAIVTCVVKAGLPANMMAMAKRAEQVCTSDGISQHVHWSVMWDLQSVLSPLALTQLQWPGAGTERHRPSLYAGV